MPIRDLETGRAPKPRHSVWVWWMEQLEKEGRLPEEVQQAIVARRIKAQKPRLSNSEVSKILQVYRKKIEQQ